MRTGRWPTLFALACVLLAGCGSDERRAPTAKGLYEVSWRPVEGVLPFNALFAIDAGVTRDGEPADVLLTFKATMPSHGHGMQTKAEVKPTGTGRFVVDGVKLHMSGAWELEFKVNGAAGEDVATFIETLE